MKSKRNVLSYLIILLTGLIYFAVQAQEKNDTHRANFSGEWKSKESISMGGNIVCSFDSGDRMLANFMKISQQENALNIEISSSFPGTAPVVGKETLTFDGKESQINHGTERGKKFTVKWSADGQTMTVNSIVHLMIATPYKVNSREQMLVYLTEVWKLSNEGKSISVQTKAKSKLYESARSWTTVFDKAN
ncbi:hypothetical protein SYJ56_03275 [Algoriphagus sp. D3-2-R+10]|uniref:hypothetical protein n=1 Tax=Algoriphagus aurantiacus TaxID=3103948 RepID=UPI002B37EDF6|nr:hypothetical protein [Algoriphagus sp. D3-2-R+10]MEB2774309.1 hypothetical protein [Algoriphagus sp. D3-2-R+10]